MSRIDLGFAESVLATQFQMLALSNHDSLVPILGQDFCLKEKYILKIPATKKSFVIDILQANRNLLVAGTIMLLGA